MGETRGLQAEKAGPGGLGDLPPPHLQPPGFPPLSLSSFLQALEEPLTTDSSSFLLLSQIPLPEPQSSGWRAAKSGPGGQSQIGIKSLLSTQRPAYDHASLTQPLQIQEKVSVVGLREWDECVFPKQPQ